MTAPRSTRRSRATVPWALLVPAMLGAAVFVVPLVGLVSRTPWSDFFDLVTSDVVIDALRISVLTSLAATLVSLPRASRS